MSVGPTQILIVVLIVIVLFGASRLGDVGKGLGEGIKNFKRGIGGDGREEEEEEESADAKQLKDSGGGESAKTAPQEKKEKV